MDDTTEPKKPATALTYRADVFVRLSGEDVRLSTEARGGSIRDLAADMVAKAADLEAEVEVRLAEIRAEDEKRQRGERAGRRHHSWE